MRHRAFALVLSFVFLLVAPRVFAEKHKDDSKKDSEKSAPAKKTEKSHTQQQQPQQQQGSSPHHSGSGSGSTSSGSSTATNDHFRHREGTGQTPTTSQATGQAQSTHESKSSGHNTYRPYEPPGTTSTPKTEHSAYSGHPNVHRDPVVVDRSHLHERMQLRPDHQARQHAYEHYRTERAQFHHHAAPLVFVPAHRVVLTHVRIVPTTYHYRRTVFYDEYGWEPPVYVYSMYPRYGLWDSVFLMFALDHIAEEQYALMFYHHQREADFQRWLADSDRLAEQNPELRDKLDAMKVQMSTLEEGGSAIDPSYVPPDAQDVALSPEVIEQLTAKASSN